MCDNIFEIINFKLTEIMNLIEHQKGFPLLSKDVSVYCDNNYDNCRLFDIYTEISNLRDF